MALKDFATELVASNRFIKASFGGFAGAGKSRTASEFVAGAYKDMDCKAPVLFIDNEKGSRFLIPFFKKRGIPVLVKDTVHLADVLQGLEYLKSGEISFLFVDTLTKIWYQYVRDYKAKNRRSFMELQDWGKILPAWQEEFSDRFVGASGNIVFTGRGGHTYEKEEDEVREDGSKKKGQFVKSGVKMKLAGETPFEPDLNVWMELEQEVTPDGLKVWREAQIMKDRSGLIDGATFKNPTYAEFQPVVQYLLDMPVGEVQGASITDNMAPGENYEYADKKRKKDVLLEEVAGLIGKHFPGQSTEEKKARHELLEKHFKTLSWKKVEGSTLEQITEGFKSMKAELQPEAA